MGEMNTLVKQWIRTDGVHQVSQRYFYIEVEHFQSYFAGYGLARSCEVERTGGKAASSWGWGREAPTLTCRLWCPGM